MRQSCTATRNPASLINYRATKYGLKRPPAADR
jgi:hypothetical protein